MKVYYIFNQETGSPVEYFLSKEEAEKFLVLLGEEKYLILAENPIYENMEEYKIKNKDAYIKRLKYAITKYSRMLKELNLYTNNGYLHMFTICYDGSKYAMGCEDMKKLLNGEYVANSIRYVGEYGPESLFHSYGDKYDETRNKELEQKLASMFVKEYEAEVEKYKKILTQCKKEYLQLTENKDAVVENLDSKER